MSWDVNKNYVVASAVILSSLYHSASVILKNPPKDAFKFALQIINNVSPTTCTGVGLIANGIVNVVEACRMYRASLFNPVKEDTWENFIRYLSQCNVNAYKGGVGGIILLAVHRHIQKHS